MSIDKATMAKKIDDFVVSMYEGSDKEDLRFLCRTVIEHEPQLNCEKHSKQELFDALPDHKTLFRNTKGKGIAIGNLFSQIFANFYLNDFDWFIDKVTPYHGRYVDDVYMIHKDKNVLLEFIPRIRDELAKIGLKLNEKKFYLQHYSKGVKFTGAVVKPARTYCANRTVAGFHDAIFKLNKAYTLKDINHAVQSINSYLGFLRQYNEYAIRCKYLKMIDKRLFEYLYIRGHYESIVIKKQFRIL
jgi:hypothetical protein